MIFKLPTLSLTYLLRIMDSVSVMLNDSILMDQIWYQKKQELEKTPEPVAENSESISAESYGQMNLRIELVIMCKC